MKPHMTLATVAGILLICGAQPCALAEPVLLPNSHFKVRMTDPLRLSNPPASYDGQFTDTHQAEYQRIGNQNGVSFSQIASFEANLAEGKVRGYHLASTSSLSIGITTSVDLYWGPTLRVGCVGCAPGDRVPLELSVKLHGVFDTDDLAGQQASAFQKFRAELMPVLLGATDDELDTWQTRMTYEFKYAGKSQPSDFSHTRSTDVNDSDCPMCSAAITGGDDSFAYGFEDLELRTVLWVEPEDEINLNFTLSGSTTVRAFGAYGDWSRTADFGFKFLNDETDRYSLSSGSVGRLDAWNSTSAVPEPPAAALALLAIAALGMWGRRAPG